MMDRMDTVLSQTDVMNLLPVVGMQTDERRRDKRHRKQSAERHVLSTLVTYLDVKDVGEAKVWPSLRTVADKTGMSRRGVLNIMRRLEDAGWIVREGRKADGVTVYRIAVDKIVDAARAAPTPTGTKAKDRKRRGSIRLTAELAIRQRGLCGICNGPLPADMTAIHRDHIVPLAAGGSDAPSNLQAVHAACNLAKGAKHDG